MRVLAFLDALPACGLYHRKIENWLPCNPSPRGLDQEAESAWTSGDRSKKTWFAYIRESRS